MGEGIRRMQALERPNFRTGACIYKESNFDTNQMSFIVVRQISNIN